MDRLVRPQPTGQKASTPVSSRQEFLIRIIKAVTNNPAPEQEYRNISSVTYGFNNKDIIDVLIYMLESADRSGMPIPLKILALIEECVVSGSKDFWDHLQLNAEKIQSLLEQRTRGDLALHRLRQSTQILFNKQLSLLEVRDRIQSLNNQGWVQNEQGLDFMDQQSAGSAQSQQSGSTLTPSSSPQVSRSQARYPWQRNDLEDFQFLETKEVCSLVDLGMTKEEYIQCTEYVAQGSLVLTSTDRATIFNFQTKGIRVFKLFNPNQPIINERSTCILSPDGNTIIHRAPDGKVSSYWLRDRKYHSSLPSHWKNVQEHDLLRAQWSNNNSIYLPVQSDGCVIRWSFLESNQTLAVHTVHPMNAVTRHQRLDFFVTSDERWWVAMGTTRDTNGVESGTIQMHDAVNDESRILPAKACCIVETEVYDRRCALLVRADNTAGGKISLKVERISISDSEGDQFQAVNVLVDQLNPRDSPLRIFSLDPLPIVCMITALRAIYFFELHTGTLLYCVEAPNSDVNLFPVRFQSRGGKGFYCFDGSGVMRWVTVNQGDLIGWVRRILNNDILASGIAIRTGLSGAEDVILDEMFAR